jgi:hypothetical protein
LIQQHRQPVSGRPQLLRTQPTRQLGQISLRGLAGVVIDEVGQLVEEPANDLHMLGADLAAPLSGRRRRQDRLQRLTGHRRPRPQIGGFLDAPGGIVLGDPQHRRHRRRQRRLTQLLWWYFSQPVE